MVHCVKIVLWTFSTLLVTGGDVQIFYKGLQVTSTLNLFESATGNLSCTNAQYTVPVYMWTFSSDQTFSSESSYIEIKNIKLGANGNYTCSTWNNTKSGSPATASVQLNVLYPPVIEDLSRKDVFVGQIIYAFCNVSGNPSPKVKWKKENTIIQSGTHLAIKNARKRNSGDYTCIASNVMIDTTGEMRSVEERKTFTVQVKDVPKPNDKGPDATLIAVAIAGWVVAVAILVIGIVYIRRLTATDIPGRNSSTRTHQSSQPQSRRGSVL